MNSKELHAEYQRLTAAQDAIDSARAGLRERKHKLIEATESDPLALYHPSTPEECKWGDSQLLVHMSEAKETCVFGAVRSGKTTIGAATSAWHITGKYPDYFPKANRLLEGEERHRPLSIRIFGTNWTEGISEDVWPMLEYLLPSDLRVPPQHNTQGGISKVYLPNGCEVVFGTYTQKITAQKGTTGDFYWLNEAPDSAARYYQIVRGSLDRKARILITATPEECEWFDDRLENDGNSDPKAQFKANGDPIPFVAHLDIRDNRHIPEDEVQWYMSILDEDEFQTKILGRSRSNKKILLPQFDKKLHVVEPFALPTRKGSVTGKVAPDGWTLYMGIDPHDAHPPAITYLAIFDPKYGEGLSKMFLVREDWTPGLVIPTAIERMKTIEEELHASPVRRMMDQRQGSKRTAETGNTIQSLYSDAGRKAKLPIGFTLGVPDIAVRHELFRRALLAKMPCDGPFWQEGEPQLQFFNTCRLCCEAVRRYRRKDLDHETPVDDNNKHWTDSVGYILADRPRYSKSKLQLEDEDETETRALTTLERMILEAEGKGGLDGPFFSD